jgi:hypothetical protein
MGSSEDATLTSYRWIYQLLLSEDANYKMKGCARSSREKDPTLGPGYAYMVASDGYLKHLAKYMETDEVSVRIGPKSMISFPVDQSLCRFRCSLESE